MGPLMDVRKYTYRHNDTSKGSPRSSYKQRSDIFHLIRAWAAIQPHRAQTHILNPFRDSRMLVRVAKICKVQCVLWTSTGLEVLIELLAILLFSMLPVVLATRLQNQINLTMSQPCRRVML